MSARLPTRPAPTFRPGSGRLRRGKAAALGDGVPGDRAGGGRSGRGPLWRRPLALVFRRPARTLPAPVLRSRDGAAVRLSLSLSLRVWLAERLTTLVRGVAPASGADRQMPSAADGTRAPVAVAQRAWRLGATRDSGPGRATRRPLSPREPDAVRAPRGARLDRNTPADRIHRSGSETTTTRPTWRTPPPSDGDGQQSLIGSRPAARPTAPGVAAESLDVKAPPTVPPLRHRTRGSRLGAAPQPLMDRLADAATPAPAPARRRLRRPTGPAAPHPGGYPATELRVGPRLRSAPRPAPAPPAPGPLAVPDRPPAALVHRSRPAVVDAHDAPAPTPPPTAAAAPAVDLDRLDRELWHRFEKRMRIERERRGRG
ncbi:hypothetical protein V5H98_11160 [Georgenia sp. M64]|uniref:hypothetical protein n=1 Tax=Georgenia sp. M64 TaxID=3120520 RepID=UPI0030DEBBEE